MPFEIPAPSLTFEVPLEDGARIKMRRHGNPDGVRLLITHGNGFAADAYYPYWQHLLAKFDVLVFDFRNHVLRLGLAASAVALTAAADAGAAVLTALPLGRTSLFRAVRGKTVPEWAKDFDAATWGQFFLKFLLGNPQVTAVIPGTGNPEHMIDNLGAGRGRMPDAQQRERMAAVLHA